MITPKTQVEIRQPKIQSVIIFCEKVVQHKGTRFEAMRLGQLLSLPRSILKLWTFLNVIDLCYAKQQCTLMNGINFGKRGKRRHCDCDTLNSIRCIRS